MRPELPPILRDEVEQTTGGLPVGIAELRRGEAPAARGQHRLAVGVACDIVPGVQGPWRRPGLLVSPAEVVGHVAAEREAPHAGHHEVAAHVALEVVPLVLIVSGGVGRNHDRVVAILDVGTRLPVGPVCGKIRLASHQLAENRARAADGEIAVLESGRDVEPQVQVFRHAPVDVAPEVVLVVVGAAVPIIPVLGLTAQREVVADAVGATPQRHVRHVLQ